MISAQVADAESAESGLPILSVAAALLLLWAAQRMGAGAAVFWCGLGGVASLLLFS